MCLKIQESGRFIIYRRIYTSNDSPTLLNQIKENFYDENFMSSAALNYVILYFRKDILYFTYIILYFRKVIAYYTYIRSKYDCVDFVFNL